MNPARIALAALAALRLTRLVTSDKLGEWTMVGPAKRWAWRYDRPAGLSDAAAKLDPNNYDYAEESATTPLASWGWRSKLVSGLDCPFCVGFWIGGVVLLAEIATRRVPVLRGLWSFAAGMLALNYVTGHVSKRIDG